MKQMRDAPAVGAFVPPAIEVGGAAVGRRGVAEVHVALDVNQLRVGEGPPLEVRKEGIRARLVALRRREGQEARAVVVASALVVAFVVVHGVRPSAVHEVVCRRAARPQHVGDVATHESSFERKRVECGSGGGRGRRR